MSDVMSSAENCALLIDGESTATMTMYIGPRRVLNSGRNDVERRNLEWARRTRKILLIGGQVIERGGIIYRAHGGIVGRVSDCQT